MSVAAHIENLECATLELEVRDAVLTVRVHRPEALNALSPEVIAELREVFDLLRSLGRADAVGDPDWSIRGVILTGSGGRAFVAGADITRMRDMSREEVRAYTRDAQELTVWIETLPVPVVAAVNGFALGGGCELAMACDMIYASENAAFGQPEVALGLIPGFGGCVRLQQYVGIAAARELILTGRRIPAEEAQRIGLVSRVLPDTGALMGAARESIALVAAQSPTAVAAAKRAIRAAQALPTDAGLQIELEAFADRFGTPDMTEGTAAFVEKRTPRFPGL
ncbi:enoyl-CoA hydratase/isomerase family protein [Leucobacter sp. CSA1]|uniref:enoyl-CoA hydratase n=1 Tax=Leucobacter chromiisoli TaxID=2796471 RepID=A0A934UVH5_9MICO|nr:enoyl-CoA hydratase-related protein [Leucobacter chromiisoli]MBK0418952.1 enoyl-CoA hydratase/isomerase family protein [Leucobacter chromiisoli]